ncbi:hypothetical protein [Mycoplasma putrefaciens]|uniref:Uncharacterized protein n=1 Tax=Mycoplasma putrefaciens (strain ATCC 15718 / NCTC 10155 / C30 KS-1 / KS-1) TaxID=743965 RepID=A0A7U4E9I7_MYCPK|nr:hypothetical protein [Mycoplasma putrefaciens]AEM68579.1 uncharacterized protein MPUT_0185 [Mycoplasma putrefaciens KS1]
MNIVHKEIEVSNRSIIVKPNYCCDVIFSKQKYYSKKQEVYRLKLLISKNKRSNQYDHTASLLTDFKYKLSYKTATSDTELETNFKEPLIYKISNDQKQFIDFELPVKLFENNKLDLVFSCQFQADHKIQNFTSDIKLNISGSSKQNLYKNNLINYYKNYDHNSLKNDVVVSLLTYQLNYQQEQFVVNKKYQKLVDFKHHFKVNLDRDFNNNSEINKLINDLLTSDLNNYFAAESLQLNDHQKANKFYKTLPKILVQKNGLYFDNKAVIVDDSVVEKESETKGFIFNSLLENNLYLDFKVFNDHIGFNWKVQDLEIISLDNLEIKESVIKNYQFSKEFFSTIELMQLSKLEKEINKYEVE